MARFIEINGLAYEKSPGVYEDEKIFLNVENITSVQSQRHKKTGYREAGSKIVIGDGEYCVFVQESIMEVMAKILNINN